MNQEITKLQEEVKALELQIQIKELQEKVAQLRRKLNTSGVYYYPGAWGATVGGICQNGVSTISNVMPL